MKSTINKAGYDCVILLHGLARTNRSMLKMENALTRQGYQTFNCNYPSRHHPIEMLSEKFIPQAIAYCLAEFNPGKIHFVTHSMGGILLRYYLAQNKLPKLGRVVMLAPPNAGSELVDHLSRFQLFNLVNGPAGKQLGTSQTSLPNQLGPVDYEVGIIAGNKSKNPISSWLIPGEHDGKVSTARAQLGGMSDFIVLPYGHTFTMNKPEVINQTLEFLANGKFNRQDNMKD